MRKSISIVASAFFLLTGIASSFEIPVHVRISGIAMDASSVSFDADEPLAACLESCKTLTAIQWLQEGAAKEDDIGRSVNHFHNPLRAWNLAGLGSVWRASATWINDAGQSFSWPKARAAYFAALTGKTDKDRNQKFAETYRTLGHVIHLVQDAAVPAHTRNDPHFFYEGLEKHTGQMLRTQPATFDGLASKHPALPSATLNCAVGPACAIDKSNLERTAAAPSATLNQGLAEYSNANFFSGNTVLNGRFVHPRRESIDLDHPVTIDGGHYFRKLLDGDTGYLLAAEGLLTRRLRAAGAKDLGLVLDQTVYLDYARRLIPRAVSYSIGVIDHFFRGRLASGPAQTSYFQRTPPPPTLPIRIVNESAEETGAGTIVGVLMADGATLQKFPGIPKYVVSAQTAFTPTRSLQNLTLSFAALPFPPTFGAFGTGCCEARYHLSIVFKGKLGAESGAVVETFMGGVGWCFVYEGGTGGNTAPVKRWYTHC